MTTSAQDLLHRIHDLEEQLEHELARRRRDWRYRLEANRVRFEHEVHVLHRRLRHRIPRFIRDAPLRHLVTVPIIYAVAVPLLFLDLAFTVYQAICFPLYGIPRVPRHRYLVIDRQHLAYLNGIEKLNCIYCGYATGLLGYTREIAARTEQYWCPIKHARRLRSPHTRYHRFVDYGDAEGYREELARLRGDFDDVERP